MKSRPPRIAPPGGAYLWSARITRLTSIALSSSTSGRHGCNVLSFSDDVYANAQDSVIYQNVTDNTYSQLCDAEGGT
jgi:hypothetical protein